MAMTLTPKDFATATPSWWCAGLRRLRRALGAQVRRWPNSASSRKDVAFVSGIGCSGKISGYLHCYAFHGVHGRALPVATAVKLANRDLTVIAAGGDGDGYAIGAGHFVHALRRNPDITYIVMDNQTYGLTKGQSSPTSATGYVAGQPRTETPRRRSTGSRSRSPPAATFLARGFSAQPKQLVEMMKAAVGHRGFSIVEVMSPCVTYNKINTYAWFKENVDDVDGATDYAPRDRIARVRRADARGDRSRSGSSTARSGRRFEDRTGLPQQPIARLDVAAQRSAFAAMQEAYR